VAGGGWKGGKTGIWIKRYQLLCTIRWNIIYTNIESVCCTSETNIVNKLHLNQKNVLNLRKKKKLETSKLLNILNFRQYYKATVIKTVILAQKQTYASMNRIGKPEINPHTYSQLI